MDYFKFPRLIELCKAMEKMEGNTGTNPGNIRCPVENRNIWNHLAVGSKNGFCVFPSRNIGMTALREKIYKIAIGASAVYNAGAKNKFKLSTSADLTIFQMISIYAPSEDNNDPYHYAVTVCKWANLNINEFMGSLIITPPEASKIVEVQRQTSESTSVPSAWNSSEIPNSSSTSEIPNNWFVKLLAFLTSLFRV